MKILVLCLPGIGDALMATPMIRILKRELPSAQIDVACMFGGVEYVFKNNKNVTNIHLLKIFNQNRLVGALRVLALRKEKYDVSILAFPAYRRDYHIVQWLVGAKKRVAHTFGRGYLSEFNFLDSDLLPFNSHEHHIDNNLNLLKFLSIDWQKKYKAKSDLYYDFEIDRQDIEFGKKYIKDLGWDKENIVAFHPGSKSSPSGKMRRWPINNFAKLGKVLIEREKKIIIFVGPDEIELGDELFSLINDNKKCHLVKNANFNQAMGVLKEVSLIITHDAGFSHLSNALKVKSIILYGPTNMDWTCPPDRRYCKPIRKAPFDPWFRNDIKVEQPPKDATNGTEFIKVEDVLSQIDK